MTQQQHDFWNKIYCDPWKEKKERNVLQVLQNIIWHNLSELLLAQKSLWVWGKVKTHCSICLLCPHTLIHILYCPPGRAGTASWQLQCEGLWVFSLVRVKDYGLLTAFVWKNNISVHCVEASANNTGSPEAWMFFDGLLISVGHTK